MIRRPLVAKYIVVRKWGMVNEKVSVSKDAFQKETCKRRLDGTMELTVEVRRRNMYPSVICIAARRHGRGIGRPHAGRDMRGQQQAGVVAPDSFQYVGIGTSITFVSEQWKIRALMRRKHCLFSELSNVG